jgi:quinolinate synthase
MLKQMQQVREKQKVAMIIVHGESPPHIVKCIEIKLEFIIIMRYFHSENQHLVIGFCLVS